MGRLNNLDLITALINVNTVGTSLLFSKTRPEVSREIFLKKGDFNHWLKACLWLLPDQVHHKLYMRLGTKILRLWNTNGSKFLVLYLKQCSIVLMKFIAKDSSPCPVSGSTPSIQTDRGLPSIIPISLRKLVREDMAVSKAVLSIFAVYRVIKFKTNPDYSSIILPFSGLSDELPEWEISLVCANLKEKFVVPHELMIDVKLDVNMSSGPNLRPSCLGSVIDSWALFGNLRVLRSMIWLILDRKYYKVLLYFLVALPFGLPLLILKKMKGEFLSIGRLAKKNEAAGKVRIFAIADFFTQVLLKPVHIYLNDILKQIPQDGTFDQLKPAKALLDKCSGPFYSFDLTSATDRIPVSLQKQVISSLLGPTFAEHWITILTDREWFVGSGNERTSLRYAVGQPMGASSSWPVMALTHHFLVQISALRTLRFWFSDYCILGDDIVIADRVVAEAYQGLCSSLGIGISQAKSLVSEDTMEFAKRLISKRADFSPLGPKSILRALSASYYIPSALADAISKGMIFPNLQDKIMTLGSQSIKLFAFKPESHLRLLAALAGPTSVLGNVTSVSLSRESLWSLLLESKSLSGTTLLHAIPLFSFLEKKEKLKSLVSSSVGTVGRLVTEIHASLIMYFAPAKYWLEWVLYVWSLLFTGVFDFFFRPAADIKDLVRSLFNEGVVSYRSHSEIDGVKIPNLSAPLVVGVVPTKGPSFLTQDIELAMSYVQSQVNIIEDPLPIISAFEVSPKVDYELSIKRLATFRSAYKLADALAPVEIGPDQTYRTGFVTYDPQLEIFVSGEAITGKLVTTLSVDKE